MLKTVIFSFHFYITFQNDFITKSASAAKMDPELNERLEAGEKVDIVVSFTQSIKEALQQASAIRHANHLEKVLEENADSSQALLITELSNRVPGVSGSYKYFKKYWINNKLMISEADAALVKFIDEDPNVSRIQLEPVYDIPPRDPPTENTVKVTKRQDEEIQWGVKRIQAPEAWALLEGKKGDGVVVATIDTGVRHTHEALCDNFRGINYGWYDAVEKNPEPFDQNGHGTHVTANLAGRTRGVGVAPGVTWITCRACDQEKCKFEHLADCMTWAVCPWLPDGSEKDCSMAPKIISMSIADMPGSDNHKEEVEVWRTVGIVPVIAIGNRGPGCGTACAPGEFPNVIGVGATQGDHMWAGSSIGPGSGGIIKPDIVAPGSIVFSADFFMDDAYYHSSGTSMATPHVAGVAALLVMRQPDITYEEVYELLTENTVRSAFEPIEDCMYDGTVYPNNYVGYGEVNALKAVEAQNVKLGKKK